MRIAILGAGNVGGGLATAFSAIGHSVVFGVRDPDSEKCRRALATTPGATAAPPASAVGGAEVVDVSPKAATTTATIAARPASLLRIRHLPGH